MTKKKLTGFGAILAAIAAAIVATKQPHHHDPGSPIPDPGVPVYTLTARVCSGPCERDEKLPGASVEIEGQPVVITDDAGNANLLNLPAGKYRVCATLEGYKAQCADHAVPADGDVSLALERNAVALAPLSTDGPIFRAGGQPVRWRGVTAFRLLDRFAHGENIDGFLTDFAGYNVLRVFGYTPAKDWGAQAWDAPTAEQVKAFAAYVERFGFYVEYVALTDDDSARIGPAKALLAQLAGSRTIVAEVGNEPQTHKAIDTGAFRDLCSGAHFLCSSGDYEDSRKWFGQWIGFHSGRDGDWPRRAHDAMEYYNGGGPNDPSEPALKVPAVCDEPIRPDQAGFNAQDFRAYFGACALLGGGATYHFESGKYGNRPTPDEARLAAVVLEALNAFPADAPKGPYRRPVENSLRTYVVGPYMVRVRPTTKDAPEHGWTALDDAGILWKR